MGLQLQYCATFEAICVDLILIKAHEKKNLKVKKSINSLHYNKEEYRNVDLSKINEQI